MVFCAAILLGSRWHIRQKRNSWKDVGTYVVGELCDTSASSLKAFALSLGPASVVQALEGIQSLFVMGFESLGLVGKRIHRTRTQKARIIVASIFAIAGLLLIVR